MAERGLNGMSEQSPVPPLKEGPRTDIAGWLGEGWRTFKGEPLVFILSTAIMGGIIIIVSPIPFAGVLLTAPMIIGFYMVAGDISRGLPFNAGRLFAGFRHFVPAVLASLVISVFTMLGLVLLIIPGLVVYSWYMFTYLFILDRGMGFWEAMEASRKLASGDMTGFFLFYLALIAINVAGFLCLLVGLFVSLPVSFLAIFAAYRKLAGFDRIAGPPSGEAPSF